MSLSKQITKIFYLIADGYNYNAKLSKFLKKSKATLNTQLNELKKQQLIKGTKKPGNVTEFDLNYDRLAELVIGLLKGADEDYQKKFKKLPPLDIKAAEACIKSCFKERYFQSLLKEHFSVCLNQDVDLAEALAMFLRGIGSFQRSEIKKQPNDFQELYHYARDFYLKELVFNPVYIFKKKIIKH